MNAMNKIANLEGLKHHKKKNNINCLLKCLCRQQTSGVSRDLSQERGNLMDHSGVLASGPWTECWLVAHGPLWGPTSQHSETN